VTLRNSETTCSGELYCLTFSPLTVISLSHSLSLHLIMFCTACATNCRQCVSNGPGLCDRCAAGYHLTSANLCEGKLVFYWNYYMFICRAVEIND